MTAPPVLGNRYVLEDVLGQGGMGEVYRAHDRLTGRGVALKRVFALSQDPASTMMAGQIDARLALAHEFQTLASLRHPNIISVLDYGFDFQRQPYFTMDLLRDACDIRSAGRDQPIEVKIDLLAQTLQALDYLHRRRIIHRDLKPSNLLVQQRHLTVLDFGLATLTGRHQRGVSGSVAYMAPELFDQQPATVASDLYAVGVIAFELFEGHHPFYLDSITRLIDEVRSAEPVYKQIDPGTRLGILIQQLLAKDPAVRPSDAQQVIIELCNAAGLPLPAENAAIRESYLQTAPLVGRDAELATLELALLHTVDGHGAAWLLGGESGVGKSRLVSELATRALIEGALVVRGQAIQEGGWPFQLWVEPLRRLILAAEVSDPEAAILKDLVPEIDDLIGRAVGSAPPLPTPADQQGRLRETLVACFRRQTQPTVLIMEDLQWVSRESRELLRALNAIANEFPVLVLATFRDDEQPDLPADLPEMTLLRLKRLSREQISTLSSAMLGKAGNQPELIGFLQRETEGNVFFLIETVRALAEEAGQIAAIGREGLPSRVAAGGIQRVLQARLRRVPEEGLPLLRAAAVHGNELDKAVLARIAPDTPLDVWLGSCANAAVLQVVEDHWQFAHDKLRLAVLNDIPSEVRRGLHEQIALAIEACYPDSPAQVVALAYHWKMAEQPAYEARYTRLAGEQARRITDAATALGFFERSLELSSDPSERALLNARIAESLFWLGEFDRSRKHNLEAAALARQQDDQRTLGMVLGSLGNTAIQQGDYATAQVHHAEALAIGRVRHDNEILSHALAGLGDIAWRLGDFDRAMDYLRENLSVAASMNDLTVKGHAYNMVGIVYAMRHQLAESKEAFGHSLAISEEIGDRSRTAQALSNLGEVALMENAYADARSYFNRALRLSKEAHNRYSTGNIEIHLGVIALELETAEVAEAHFRDALRNATRINSALLMLGALAGFARLEAARSRSERALELIGLVLGHPASSADVKEMISDALIGELRGILPDTAATALERGRHADLPQWAERYLREEFGATGGG